MLRIAPANIRTIEKESIGSLRLGSRKPDDGTVARNEKVQLLLWEHWLRSDFQSLAISGSVSSTDTDRLKEDLQLVHRQPTTTSSIISKLIYINLIYFDAQHDMASTKLPLIYQAVILFLCFIDYIKRVISREVLRARKRAPAVPRSISRNDAPRATATEHLV